MRHVFEEWRIQSRIRCSEEALSGTFPPLDAKSNRTFLFRKTPDLYNPPEVTVWYGVALLSRGSHAREDTISSSPLLAIGSLSMEQAAGLCELFRYSRVTGSLRWKVLFVLFF